MLCPPVQWIHCKQTTVTAWESGLHVYKSGFHPTYIRYECVRLWVCNIRPSIGLSSTPNQAIEEVPGLMESQFSDLQGAQAWGSIRWGRGFTWHKEFWRWRMKVHTKVWTRGPWCMQAQQARERGRRVCKQAHACQHAGKYKRSSMKSLASSWCHPQCMITVRACVCWKKDKRLSHMECVARGNSG